MKLNRIDVHAHYVQPGTVPRANSAQNFVSSPMPRWTPEFALGFMDRHDIATQMLSLPSHLSREEARTINEYGATVGKQYPDALACSQPYLWMTSRLRCPRSPSLSTNSMPTA